MDDDDARAARNRLLIVGISGLLVAGALLGLFVGLLGSTVVRVLPEVSPTATRAGPGGGGEGTSTPTETTPTSSATPTETTSPRQPRQPRPTLTASPLTAGTYERVNLTGRFPGLPAGAALQVERRQGGAWVVFPVSLTAQPDGSFATYVQTGQVGANVFRVTALGSGRSTPPVTVQIS